jgi:hypothetical protein
MKVILSITALCFLTMCASEANYSSPKRTYKRHVSQETTPVLSYSRSVNASDLK